MQVQGDRREMRETGDRKEEVREMREAGDGISPSAAGPSEWW